MLDFQNINPQDFLSIVTSVRVMLWGSELQIECLDDPVDRQAFVLIFKNCREIRWLIHEEDSLQDLEADLIGVLLGKGKHQEPAIITTDIFEIFVLYESCEIQKK